MALLQQSPARANVLGIGISVVDMSTAVGRACELIHTEGKGYICVTGVHGVMVAQQDSAFRSTLNDSFLTLPDGMPTVWVGRRQGFDMEQVTGPDFMVRLCQDAVPFGFRHFLYGGEPGVAETLRDSLSRIAPGIEIVGVYTPPFRALTDQEFDDLRIQIDTVSPDVVWIGLSTPKQERFMKDFLGRLNVKLMVGVGAAFDFHTGRIKQSPLWVKKIGMQWLHRLWQDPRLWRRYLTNNPRFIVRILLQFLGVQRFDLQPRDAQTTDHA